jgi:GH15 family glucan-1,4-alpha-glucosidase
LFLKGESKTPREIVVSNGRVLVALDKKMMIRDFFYPNVGLENHIAGHSFKIGVWIEDRFSWIDENWDIKMKYLPETLVSMCIANSKETNLQLEVNDAVHSFLDVYLRKIVIHNNQDKKREVRLFFSHDFHIYGEDTGDTAIYEPTLKSIIHYKRKRYFLINGITDQNQGIYQFATGQKESFGKQGTWKDAEDGILQGNPVAQGSVDSTISFKLEIEPNSSKTLYYWIACGKDLNQIKNLDSKIKKTGVEQLLLETENYWSAWINKQTIDTSILPRAVARLFKNSLLIMRSHVDHNGGIISSCDSDVLQFNRDTYSYVWPRDGAIIALAFDMAGYPEVSRMFFQFCDKTINEGGYFSHKYSTDGSIGSSWHAMVDLRGQLQLPIQEDETALILFSLYKHFQKYHDVEFIATLYPRLVLKTTEFLLDYRDPQTGLPKPSFDIWEEKVGVYTSTVSTVISALQSAAKLAKVFYDRERHELLSSAAANMKEIMLAKLYDPKAKRFKKAIYSDNSSDLTVDSSISFAFTTEAFAANSEEVRNSMNAIIDKLWIKSDIGGLARYESDDYHRISKETPGNPWFICTLWLARWHTAVASSIEGLNKSLNLLNWAAMHTLPSGALAEQINPRNGEALSVAPLAWSHAEFVIAVCDYIEKQKELSSLIPNLALDGLEKLP